MPFLVLSFTVLQQNRFFVSLLALSMLMLIIPTVALSLLLIAYAEAQDFFLRSYEQTNATAPIYFCCSDCEIFEDPQARSYCYDSCAENCPFAENCPSAPVYASQIYKSLCDISCRNARQVPGTTIPRECVLGCTLYVAQRCNAWSCNVSFVRYSVTSVGMCLVPGFLSRMWSFLPKSGSRFLRKARNSFILIIFIKNLNCFMRRFK